MIAPTMTKAKKKPTPTPKPPGTPFLRQGVLIVPKKRYGAPPITIDWAVVAELYKIQCTTKEVTDIIGVSYETLNNKCQVEFKIPFAEWRESKSADGKSSLRRAQFSTAVQGNPILLIWLGKQMLGQSDSAASAVSDPTEVARKIREAVQGIEAKTDGSAAAESAAAESAAAATAAAAKSAAAKTTAPSKGSK